MTPNRAWLLTPPGPGAIAVVRFHGPGVSTFFDTHFSKPLRVGGCVHGELSDAVGTVIDDPVVAMLDEQTVDLNIHGGGAIVRATLALAAQNDFAPERLRLDESAADIIEQETHAALHLPKTLLGLQTLLAQPSAWTAQSWSPASAAAALTNRSLEYLLDPPTVALIGQANVGKSTLANRLFGRTRSIVFDQPGTTRDYVSDLADLNGLVVHLLDTPGQRTTDDPIESAAIELSRPAIESADLKILLLDPTQPAESQLSLIAKNADALIVANKSDAPARWKPRVALNISAAHDIEVNELIAGILEHFSVRREPLFPALVWTLRQRAFLQGIAGGFSLSAAVSDG